MFRDDHEAALERIAALESDLKREHSEKEATKHELDETRRALERAQEESKALVLATPTSLVNVELPYNVMVARVEAAQKRGTQVAIGIITGTLLMVGAIGLILAAVQPAGLAAVLTLALLFVPAGTLLLKRASCPACGKGIGGDRGGNQLLMLRNLKQCPHCQAKFD